MADDDEKKEEKSWQQKFDEDQKRTEAEQSANRTRSGLESDLRESNMKDT